MQTTSHLLMIKPVAFDYNAETAVNNAFQLHGNNLNAQQKAEEEFDGFVKKLAQSGIDVTVVKDTAEPHTPDSIFPNNWISFHEGGLVVLYPMFAANRRAERKPHVIETIKKKFVTAEVADFTRAEINNQFLEGTGSMVLDRENKIAYACLSPRTTISMLNEWCQKMNYTACAFTSVDQKGGEIYHTNVMMCVADRYAVVCLASIHQNDERKKVEEMLSSTQKKIIEIDYSQMNHFAGNMLQVNNNRGERFLVMSSQAYQSLTAQQIKELEKFNPIIHSDLSTIEANGGGSARCMLAEVFLTPR